MIRTALRSADCRFRWPESTLEAACSTCPSMDSSSCKSMVRELGWELIQLCTVKINKFHSSYNHSIDKSSW